jgi:hypothetical protein
LTEDPNGHVEVLKLVHADLEKERDERRGALLVRHGKGDKRREVGLDEWAGSTYAAGFHAAHSCRSARSSAL